MKRFVLTLSVLLLALPPSSLRAGESFDELVYEASSPAYAALAKQSAAFVAKLRAAADDDARAAATDSFLGYLSGVENKLSSSGKPDFAAEVRAYRGTVLEYREDLRAAAEDPLAGGGGDPFAGDSADPFAAPPPEAAARPAVKKPAYDPVDPFAAPPEEEKPAPPQPAPQPAPPAAAKKPAYDPVDPFAAPPEEEKPAVAANGDPPEPPNPYADDSPGGTPAAQRQPAAAAAVPVRPAAPGGWLSSPTAVVEIDSQLPGVGIGPFEEGDLLVLRYKSGEWTSEEDRRFKVKPDVPRIDPRERLVLIDGEWKEDVPGHTDSAPFVYTVEDGGEVSLRIGEDPGQDHEHLVDNAGTVTYLAYVIGADEAAEFRESPEGRRCQFAKTASERRAEDEDAAAKAGDPFTVETAKTEDEWSFDFTQNDGKATIKADGAEFTMHWMKGPDDNVVFAGAEYVRQLGGKKGFKNLPNTAKGFDDLIFSQGTRAVRRGEVVVFVNGAGRLLAVRVVGIRLPNPRTGFPGKLSIHWRVY